METIIVSACLLGCPCRYDGRGSFIDGIEKLKEKYNIVTVCPEVDGGLLVPRDPSEIIGDQVISNKGRDVTPFFTKGANMTLATALKWGAKYAILKTKSPSCGTGKIYDGAFSSRLIDGDGFTTSLLKKHGIIVLNEHNYLDYL